MSRLTRQQLEYYRNTYDKFDGIESNEFENICDELIKFKGLEEELGIDLLTLFKAINKGIWFNYNDLYEDLGKNFTSRPRLYYSDDFKCYCFEISFGRWVVKLKDFNKKWWLEKPKENEDD